MSTWEGGRSSCSKGGEGGRSSCSKGGEGGRSSCSKRQGREDVVHAVRGRGGRT